MENSVILCDIGNTSFHFYENGKTYKKSVKSFNPQSFSKTVYFISVNREMNGKLKELDNWIDLAHSIDMSKYYETMGIDRIVAVEALSDAVIVDAGSAITVDVVREGVFEGGFIYPGVNAMSETYKRISPALEYEFNFDLDIEKLPKNSQDAITYGFLKTLYSEVVSYSLPIVLTGGDAHKIKAIFREARVDEKLLFESMKNLLKKL